MNPPPPPPPPPHGAGAKSSGLPPGNYDIFVIPPHSAGSGFLYLPSLQTHRNSFLAGVACTVAVVLIWQLLTAFLRNTVGAVMSSGGTGFVVLMLAVGAAGWAWGKTQPDWNGPGSGGAGGNTWGGPWGNAHGNDAAGHSTGAPGAGADPRPKSTWQRASAGTGAAAGGTATGTGTGTARGGWEKAKEDTRKKEEERKKKEEDERRAKERAKTREKEARERAEREKGGRGGSASAPTTPKKHQQPTARTYLGTEDDEYSFRPYDKPKRPLRDEKSHSSMYSESSYAPSQSTSRTTPPPSHRGPYTTKDPDKIVIKAVYSFSNALARVPSAQLVSGVGSVTDGLILRITTEGLFIDDDVRGVPQREWDVKAWTMKLVESGEFKNLHALRASIRDQEGRRYVFILENSEGWKVAVGLQRLRRGSQVRALVVSTMSTPEAKGLLDGLGWG